MDFPEHVFRWSKQRSAKPDRGIYLHSGDGTISIYNGATGMDAMARVLVTSGVASGWRILQPLRPFHSANSSLDYAEAIYSDLARGLSSSTTRSLSAIFPGVAPWRPTNQVS